MSLWLVLPLVIWLGLVAAVAEGVDRLILRPRRLPVKGENATLPCPVKGGQMLVRRYGSSPDGAVIVVFPGMRGTNPFHKRILVERLSAEHTLYLLSYPGQEGAPGRARATDVAKSIADVVRAVEAHSGRPAGEMIFVGTCIGASMAVLAAGRIRPRALVLVTLWMSPARITRLFIAAHAPWKPLARLFPDFAFRMNASIRDALGRLDAVPITIFQGEDDRVAPIDDLRSMLRPNWRVVPVVGADHFMTARKCFPAFVDTVAAVAASREPPAHAVPSARVGVRTAGRAARDDGETVPSPAEFRTIGN